MLKEREFSIYLNFSLTPFDRFLPHDTFSFNQSELIIGGYDPKYMDGEFVYADVISTYEWAVKTNEIKLGDISLEIYKTDTRTMKTFIDSGTSFIYFDSETINKIV